MFWRTAECTLLGLKRNKDILEEQGEESAENKIHKCKCNWLDRLLRTENTRITRLMISYEPGGYQRAARPLRTLKDGIETFVQTGLIPDDDDEDDLNKVHSNVFWFLFIDCTELVLEARNQ